MKLLFLTIAVVIFKLSDASNNNDDIFAMGPNFFFENWKFASDLGISDFELLQNFKRWVYNSTQIKLHPDISMEYLGPDRRYGFLATTDIKLSILSMTPLSDMICGLPIKKINIGSEEISISDIGASIRYSNEELISQLDDARLGDVGQISNYKLIYELIKGNSRWNDYINLLPSLSKFASYMPQLWSNKTKSIFHMLKFTNSESFYFSVLKLMQTELNIGEQICLKYINQSSVLIRRVLCDRNLLVWSSLVFSTRSWDRIGDTCLIPVADMFNHGNQGNSLFQKDDFSIIFTEVGFKRGVELTQTYRNDLSHNEFFLLNGFPIKDGYTFIQRRRLGLSSELKLSVAPFPKIRDQIVSLKCSSASHDSYAYGPYFLSDDVNWEFSQCTIDLDLLLCYLITTSTSKKQVKNIFMEKEHFMDKYKLTKPPKIWINSNSRDPHPWNKKVSKCKSCEVNAWRLLYNDMESHLKMISDMSSYAETLSKSTASDLKYIGNLRMFEINAANRCMQEIYEYRINYATKQSRPKSKSRSSKNSKSKKKKSKSDRR